MNENSSVLLTCLIVITCLGVLFFVLQYSPSAVADRELQQAMAQAIRENKLDINDAAKRQLYIKAIKACS